MRKEKKRIKAWAWVALRAEWLCVCIKRKKKWKEDTAMCVSRPVTSRCAHMRRRGAPSAVKSTITVVCCVMTAQQRLVTARASHRNLQRVCANTETALGPKTLAALFHRHGTRRGPRGPTHSAAPVCTAAVAPPHLSDGVMRSHVTKEWQSCSSRSVSNL